MCVFYLGVKSEQLQQLHYNTHDVVTIKHLNDAYDLLYLDTTLCTGIFNIKTHVKPTEISSHACRVMKVNSVLCF